MSITHRDRRSDVDHKTRMMLRRARQRRAEAGFTPVINQRITARITAGTAMALAAAKEAGKEISEASAREQATRLVAATLPATPIGVRTRPYGARGKDYRNAA
jgi:hypothetical protein